MVAVSHLELLDFVCFLTVSEEEVGIDGWNELDDCYGFIYRKAEGGSKKFVIVKCLVMGENLVIDAMCHGEEKREPINLQIK